MAACSHRRLIADLYTSSSHTGEGTRALGP
jgi:hypothetical protein